MNEAKYEILIPKVDNLGTPLIDLSSHALTHIVNQLHLTTAHVDHDRTVHYEGREEPFDALVFISEDKPVVDSTAKQLAAYLGEVANQDTVIVTKQAENGIQTWPIKNPHYQHGMPAESYLHRPRLDVDHSPPLGIDNTQL